MIVVSVSHRGGGYPDVRIIVIHLQTSVSRWKEGKRHDCLKSLHPKHALPCTGDSVRNLEVQNEPNTSDALPCTGDSQCEKLRNPE